MAVGSLGLSWGGVPLCVWTWLFVQALASCHSLDPTWPSILAAQVGQLVLLSPPSEADRARYEAFCSAGPMGDMNERSFACLSQPNVMITNHVRPVLWKLAPDGVGDAEGCPARLPLCVCLPGA